MKDSSDLARLHVNISGRVQGVYFRASALREAQKLGLCGWVTNSADGSVELVAEGAKAGLDKLLAWCRHGPPGAHVSDVAVRWESPEGCFRGFNIKY